MLQRPPAFVLCLTLALGGCAEGLLPGDPDGGLTAAAYSMAFTFTTGRVIMK